MAEALFTRLARDDLQEIWDYLSGEAGDAVADQTLEKIQKVCDEIAGFPEAGKRVDHIRLNLRCFVVKNYIFF